MRITGAIPFVTVVLALALWDSTVSFAQKPKPKPPKPPVLGTSQLAGSDGIVGTEYTIGKEYPMNIAVTKVEYRADRVRIGNEVASPTAAEKLLVVHFAFHNPNKQESVVRGDTFRFTAVDAAGANHEYEGGVWQEASGEDLNISLKPGQKMAGYTIFRLPAKGDIEKVLVISPDDKAVRYPLKGKVAPLLSPYTDPSDKSGTSAIANIPGKLGEVLLLSSSGQHGGDPLDLTIEKAAYSDTPILEEAAEEGKRFLIVTFAVKNASPTEGQLFRGDSIKASVVTADGEAIEHSGKLLHGTQMREFELTLSRDAMTRGRIYFVVPKEAKFKSLVIKGHNDDDRPFVLDISKAL